ncbi:RNA-binding ATPase activator esf2 [Lecanora helva]
MSTRKRNQYLDAGSSDEDGGISSDQEILADSRTAGLTSRNAKRRKITTDEPVSDDEASQSSNRESNAAAELTHNGSNLEASPSPNDVPQNITTKPTSSSTKQLLIKKSSKPTHKPGVIYLSRIPPFMRPSTVKSLLSTHGAISKIFLTPEPPSNYLKRKKGGGNKKHSFIDGWVEFARKKHAKQCVDAINGQIVGGKKGGWYRDDVWNARYLRGFSWSDLMQSVRAEEREREERVRVGTKREGRERGEFLRNLERSKVEETRREKRRKREEARLDDGGRGDGVGNQDQPVGERKEGRTRGFERTFRQNEVKVNDTRQIEQPDEVKRVLSKIF